MTTRLLLWLWFLPHCYCCAAILACFLAWYSNIPEEVVFVQHHFPFFDNWLMALIPLLLVLIHFGSHLTLVILKKIPVYLFCLLVLLPWPLAYLFITFGFAFF